MSRQILSATALFCLLLSAEVRSQKPDRQSDGPSKVTQLHLIEHEINVKMHELEFKISERAIDEATVEFEKIKLHLERAHEQQDEYSVAAAKLELRQAEIRVEIQRIRSEMARLRVDLAKTGLAQTRALLSANAEKPKQPTPVKFEYIDDLEVVVIRGAKPQVDKIKALIKGVDKKKSEKKNDR